MRNKLKYLQRVIFGLSYLIRDNVFSDIKFIESLLTYFGLRKPEWESLWFYRKLKTWNKKYLFIISTGMIRKYVENFETIGNYKMVIIIIINNIPDNIE